MEEEENWDLVCFSLISVTYQPGFVIDWKGGTCKIVGERGTKPCFPPLGRSGC